MVDGIAFLCIYFCTLLDALLGVLACFFIFAPKFSRCYAMSLAVVAESNSLPLLYPLFVGRCFADGFSE